MNFVTYAQNFEDVLLWRALGHVAQGFYIDVGANDPVEHSVTKAFYDHGWRGINIEPLPGFHQAFVQQRQRDTNLAVAAGASAGELTLYDVPAVNGWATLDSTVAHAHAAEGFALNSMKVPVCTLSEICLAHVQGDIHFLKIDVEGFEAEVLKGMDFVRWRPWVVVVEATLPNSREVNFQTWEHLVTDHGYAFAYFDGLNRYYVAAEHSALMAKLQVQANVFDAFISCHLVKAWDNAKQAQEREQEAEARVAHYGELAEQAQERAQAALDEAQASAQRAQTSEERAQASEERALAAQAHAQEVTELNEAQRLEMQRVAAWAHDMQTQLLGIHQSLLWRLSAPMRYLARKPWTNVWSMSELRTAAVRWLVGQETLRALAVPVLRRFPALYDRMYGAAVNAMQASGGATPRELVPVELRSLSRPARKIYADLLRVTGQPQAD